MKIDMRKYEKHNKSTDIIESYWGTYYIYSLGHLLHHVTSPKLRSEIVTEIASRVCNRLLQQKLRAHSLSSSFVSQSTPTTTAIHPVIVDFLNVIFGTGPDSTRFWSSELVSEISRRNFDVDKINVGSLRDEVATNRVFVFLSKKVRIVCIWFYWTFGWKFLDFSERPCVERRFLQQVSGSIYNPSSDSFAHIRASGVLSLWFSIVVTMVLVFVSVFCDVTVTCDMWQKMMWCCM